MYAEIDHAKLKRLATEGHMAWGLKVVSVPGSGTAGRLRVGAALKAANILKILKSDWVRVPRRT